MNRGHGQPHTRGERFLTQVTFVVNPINTAGTSSLLCRRHARISPCLDFAHLDYDRPPGRNVQPPEAIHHSGAAMEKELSLEFLRTVENAAIASARTMGQGDRSGSDQAAVEAMRAEMDRVGMDGTIVIGEGERDEAPMLFIGEKVGAAVRDKSREYPKVDIAVDPLEGTNLCATGEPGAIVVLAASEHGGLLHA